jgi:hypothetical protein
MARTRARRWHGEPGAWSAFPGRLEQLPLQAQRVFPLITARRHYATFAGRLRAPHRSRRPIRIQACKRVQGGLR